MQAKGYVTYAGNNRWGKKTLYSFRIGTEDKFFGTGTTDHGLNKNDYIEFDYKEENGRYNVDPGSIKHIDRSESSADMPARSNAGVVRQDAKKGESGKYWDERALRDVENDKYRKENDIRIQYQSARNAAISVVDLLLRERVLKLADSAKADNVAVVMGKIDDLTELYFNRVSLVSGGGGGDVFDDNTDASGGVGLGTDKEIPWS